MSNWADALTGDQRDFVKDALRYAARPPGEATPWHGAMLTVAKLAQLLDAAEQQPGRRPELFTGVNDG